MQRALIQDPSALSDSNIYEIQVNFEHLPRVKSVCAHNLIKFSLFFRNKYRSDNDFWREKVIFFNSLFPTKYIFFRKIFDQAWSLVHPSLEVPSFLKLYLSRNS
eukprot:Pompholyxophrys_punicea_v1_NODE_248_length_2536_cov_26.149536.p1 type:complete len:104 gc:universal NODE_248_length_2536_cov_26.149536:539-850(+)